MSTKRDDVPPHPDFFVELCFPNEDMKVLREKYKFVESSPTADDDYFKSLGFKRPIDTQVCTRDRKAQLSGKSLHTLARSWFKEKSNGKDQKNDDKDDVKKYLREFVEHAKAAKVLARKERQVPSTSCPGRGRKSVVNMPKQGPSISAPPRRRKSMAKMQKQVPSTSAPRRRRNSKPEMPKPPKLPEMPELPEMPKLPEKRSFNDLFRAIELDRAGC